MARQTGDFIFNNSQMGVLRRYVNAEHRSHRQRDKGRPCDSLNGKMSA
jgi:hypothetical protein